MIFQLREPVNGLTHAFGALLSVVGLTVLVASSVNPVRPWHVTTFAVFGVALVALYSASALYHSLRVGPEAMKVLRKLDHSMVFILIAATYTPLCLIGLGGGWGWSIFGVVWGTAAFGIAFKFFWMNAPRWLSTALYIAMGWTIIVGIWPLIQRVPLGAVIWLVIGGLFYTVGGVIYGLRRPNPFPGKLGFHEIFHILCILGSLSHFWVMYGYVAGMNK